MTDLRVKIHRVVVQEAIYSLNIPDEVLEEKSELPTEYFIDHMPDEVSWEDVIVKRPYFHEAAQSDED
jgi:hypothetical protein